MPGPKLKLRKRNEPTTREILYKTATSEFIRDLLVDAQYRP